jgi:hypothetical protein
VVVSIRAGPGGPALLDHRWCADGGSSASGLAHTDRSVAIARSTSQNARSERSSPSGPTR